MNRALGKERTGMSIRIPHHVSVQMGEVRINDVILNALGPVITRYALKIRRSLEAEGSQRIGDGDNRYVETDDGSIVSKAKFPSHRSTIHASNTSEERRVFGALIDDKIGLVEGPAGSDHERSEGNNGAVRKDGRFGYSG
jgi:hypothetical protein